MSARKMRFDFSKLRGLIVEKYGCVSNFSSVVNISDSALSQKLRNDSIFTPEQIIKIVDKLDIDSSDIGVYFFKVVDE